MPINVESNVKLIQTEILRHMQNLIAFCLSASVQNQLINLNSHNSVVKRVTHSTLHNLSLFVKIFSKNQLLQCVLLDADFKLPDIFFI